MPISLNQRGLLNDMLQAGADPAIIAGLEREWDTKPAVGNVGERGILSQRGFADYQSKKDEEIATLSRQVTELASNKETIKYTSDPKIIQELTERNNTLERILIEQENYDPIEVKNISLETKTKAIEVLNALKEKKTEENVNYVY